MTSTSIIYFLSFWLAALEGDEAQNKGQSESPPAVQQDSQAAARRTILLQAIYSTRLFPGAKEPSAPAIIQRFEEDRQKIVSWLKSEGLWKQASGWEKALLETPAGKRSPADKGRVHQQRESLAILLYSLGMLQELPSFDREFRLDPEVAKKLPATGKPTAAFISQARLRPAADLERAGSIGNFWFLRARTQEKLESGEFPRGEELKAMARQIRDEIEAAGLEPRPIADGQTLFKEMVRFSVHWAHKEGMIDQPIEEDYPVKDRSYGSLDKKELDRLRAISRERQRALTWLERSNEADDWDNLLEEAS